MPSHPERVRRNYVRPFRRKIDYADIRSRLYQRHVSDGPDGGLCSGPLTLFAVVYHYANRAKNKAEFYQWVKKMLARSRFKWAPFSEVWLVAERDIWFSMTGEV